MADLKGKIVISDETGNGIVPADAEDRRVRETTGRLCCRIAQNADEVYRVFAGIPVKIKG
jgi:adenosylcobinamide kinase/adenosylcobinamide-phosphate guanylyltransferase